MNVELSALLYSDLIDYGEVLGGESGTDAPTPSKLIPAMLARFMATDRAFATLRRNMRSRNLA